MTGRVKVAIVVHDGVELLDFAGPGEAFANVWNDQRRPLTQVYTVAATTEPVLSQGFLRVLPTYGVAEAPLSEILVIPGGETKVLLESKPLMAWLARAAQDAQTVLSVCTGAMALAQLGLLDGLEATTWHGAIERLRAAAPATRVLSGVRWVDNGKYVTTAGVSAGIDGALHVICRRWGPDAAHAVARYMEYDKWDPGAGSTVAPVPGEQRLRG